MLQGWQNVPATGDIAANLSSFRDFSFQAKRENVL